jgi:hypothetical protein
MIELPALAILHDGLDEAVCGAGVNCYQMAAIPPGNGRSTMRSSSFGEAAAADGSLP